MLNTFQRLFLAKLAMASGLRDWQHHMLASKANMRVFNAEILSQLSQPISFRLE